MSKTLSPPPHSETSIRRVAILFSGGPAPAANAVISTAAVSFLRNDIEVVGIQQGYSSLIDYSPEQPLAEGRDYVLIDHSHLKRSRNSQGIMIGTARANPGKQISGPADLTNEEKVRPLRCVYEGLRSLGVDALVSIGGDDTLKTANKFQRFQEHLPEGSPRIPVVHLPKTIDNDYMGIDFTFGYFTAVDTLATEIRNLLADAEANSSYFLVETMGRSAGWLAYGAAIAGEASLVISVEDITEDLKETQVHTDTAGTRIESVQMKVSEVVSRIAATIRVREEQEGKRYGVIVLAEGLAEYLPQQYIAGIERDDFGHIAISKVNLSGIFARLVAKEYEVQTGNEKKITPLQLGYEARCARPSAFDVMLGSQLGVGAYRALVEEGHDGVMVSVSGQLDLNYVPFERLVDPANLVTVVRYVKQDCDFHRLVRFLETHVND